MALTPYDEKVLQYALSIIGDCVPRGHQEEAMEAIGLTAEKREEIYSRPVLWFGIEEIDRDVKRQAINKVIEILKKSI